MHRPYAIPNSSWVMAQRWHDLLFAHYPVAVEAMRKLVPSSLELDAFDGRAWISVVPFRMSGVRPRGVPPVPWLSNFPELNVRTYVTRGEKAGVYFFSLEAANPLAVRIARNFFHLPYMDATMTLREADGWIHYRSERTHRGEPPARWVGRYRPTGEVQLTQRGTLDHWLTERYCMYPVTPSGRVFRGEIDHVQWPVQPAEAEIEDDTMLAPLGLKPADRPILQFVRRLDVRIWGLSLAD